MDIVDGLLPDSLNYFALALWLLILLWVLRDRRGLRRLLDAEQLHVYLGASVAMLVLWMLRAGIEAGLNLHVLAVTAMTLMFGWRLSVVAVSAVLALSAANGAGGWASLGVNFLIMGAAPIALTELLLGLARRHLPLHFFVYVFVNAFLCGGLSVVLSGGLSALLLTLIGPYSAAYVTTHYLNFYSLMFFPEALFNGMVMTLVIAYRPHWTSSFVDDVYLDGK